MSQRLSLGAAQQRSHQPEKFDWLERLLIVVAAILVVIMLSLYEGGDW